MLYCYSGEVEDAAPYSLTDTIDLFFLRDYYGQKVEDEQIEACISRLRSLTNEAPQTNGKSVVIIINEFVDGSLLFSSPSWKPLQARLPRPFSASFRDRGAASDSQLCRGDGTSVDIL